MLWIGIIGSYCYFVIMLNEVNGDRPQEYLKKKNKLKLFSPDTTNYLTYPIVMDNF
jgi:hypothetical protein